MKQFLREIILVAAIGGALSFVANQVSPKGLSLTRNYFPPMTVTPSPTDQNSDASLAQTNGPANVSAGVTEKAHSRLKARGLQPVEHSTVVEWFQDPGYQQERIIFVDARDDRNYEAGHIPGAFQLDYYRPETYLPAVLQSGSMAEKIVVYCNGGDCEDSELAAQMLSSALPADRMHIYVGGITEWGKHGLPLETGARNSGVLKTAR